MKKLFLAFIGIALVCISCNVNLKSPFKPDHVVVESGNIVEKTFNLGMFDEVDVYGSLNVNFVPSAGEYKVKVKCSDNIMDLFSVQNNDATLKLSFKKDVSVRYNTLDITVYAPTLETLWVGGSGKADLSEGLSTDDLKLEVSGSGNIHGMGIKANDVDIKVTGSGNIKIADLTAEELEAEITGSGDIALAGTANKADYKISGSGNIEGSAMVAERGEVSITGSGNVRCNVKQLSQHISGSGKVKNRFK